MIQFYFIVTPGNGGKQFLFLLISCSSVFLNTRCLSACFPRVRDSGKASGIFLI